MRSTTTNGYENSVLVLDDNPHVCSTVMRVAKACGYKVEAVTSPNEFFSRYAQQRPTLLVLDVVIGDGDVCEVLDFLGREGNTAPLILMSGHDYRILHAVAKLAKGRGLCVIDVVEKGGVEGRLRAVMRAHLVRGGVASEA